MSLPPCRTLEYMPGQSLDVYEPPARSSSPGRRPAIVFLPGGGLVTRDRKQCTSPDRRWIIERTLERRIVFISADYPILKEDADGQAILDGVLKLFAFVTAELGSVVDVQRLGVIGSSAGGYVAQQIALHVRTPVRAMGLLWPMGGNFITNRLWTHPWPKIEGFFSRISPDSPLIPLLLHGNYLDQLTGQTGFAEKLRSTPPDERPGMISGPSRAFFRDLRALFPELNVAHANSWPPTFIAHGTADTAVSVEESRALAARLEARGDVDVEARFVEGGEHGLEGGVDAQRVREELWEYVASRVE